MMVVVHVYSRSFRQLVWLDNKHEPTPQNPSPEKGFIELVGYDYDHRRKNDTGSPHAYSGKYSTTIRHGKGMA